MNSHIPVERSDSTAPTMLRSRPQMLQRKCACGGSAAGGECSVCAEKKQALQRSSSQHRQADAPAAVQEVLASPGRPLESSSRAFMEQRLGRDFSQVRVHHDGRASQSARGVNAHAYTVGHHVVFGPGKYAPQTRQGRHLLAHELTHVAQQGNGGAGATQYAKAVSVPSDASEVEAETVADRVMSGQPVRVRQPAQAAVQGLSIGESIGIGVGVAAGATALGLGIAALAGAFGGRQRWRIRQSNNDGANYSSEVDLTFNPDRDTMNCSEIAFVQSLIFADATSGASVETIPNYVERATAAGWTLDRIEGRRFGWYGYNNDGRPSGTVSPGSSPRPLRSATLHDTPRDVRPNSVFRFETCAICRTGTDVNKVYSCYTWGFSVDAANHLTSLPNQESAAPSAEFSDSVRSWNLQAAGPAARRNDPNQEPLGPFR